MSLEYTLQNLENLEEHDRKQKSKELFSQFFRDYINENPDVKQSLLSYVASETGVSKLTISQNISKLRNSKPFLLMSNDISSFRRLCIILNGLDQEFVNENVSLLYSANLEFKQYREEKYLKK